jgi:hypothetical protein
MGISFKVTQGLNLRNLLSGHITFPAAAEENLSFTECIFHFLTE